MKRLFLTITLILWASTAGAIDPGFWAAVTSGGGAGPSLPAPSNLIAQFSADSLTPQTDGTKISAGWVDSVNGIVAAQTTDANRPTYLNSGIGGKPAVVFAGTQWMPIATPGVINTAINSGKYTIVMAISNTASSSYGTVFGTGAGGNFQGYMANGTRVGRYDATATRKMAPLAASGFTVFGATSTTPYSIGAGTGLERIYIQGGCVASNTAPGPTTSSTYAIGSLNAAGNSSFNFKGRVYEVLVWDRALSPTEMYQVQGYLSDKYSQATPWSSGNSIVVYDGDSQTANVGTDDLALGYPYQSAQALGLNYGQWTMMGVGGITLPNNTVKISEFSGIATVTGKRLVSAFFEYYNSRDLSGAAHYSAMQDYITAILMAFSIRNSRNGDGPRIWLDCIFNDCFARIHVQSVSHNSRLIISPRKSQVRSFRECRTKQNNTD